VLNPFSPSWSVIADNPMSDLGRLWMPFGEPGGAFKIAAMAAMISFGATIAAVAATPEAPADAQDAAEELFVSRCSMCHEPATATTESHTDTEWREIVERMIMNGAPVTDPEKETIVAYLAKNHGPSTPQMSQSQ
jgi:mono/diheme cytochrome c family protein